MSIIIYANFFNVQDTGRKCCYTCAKNIDIPAKNPLNSETSKGRAKSKTLSRKGLCIKHKDLYLRTYTYEPILDQELTMTSVFSKFFTY